MLSSSPLLKIVPISASMKKVTPLAVIVYQYLAIAGYSEATNGLSARLITCVKDELKSRIANGRLDHLYAYSEREVTDRLNLMSVTERWCQLKKRPLGKTLHILSA